MSHESQGSGNHESSTHAQSVGAWAQELKDPTFVPTLEQYDGLKLAAKHINSSYDRGTDTVTYTDIDGNTIKAPVAEAVLRAADEAYWEESPEDKEISKTLATASGPGELKKDKTAYAAFETYCARNGLSPDTSAFHKFVAQQQRRPALQAQLTERRASIEAGAKDPAKDALIRSLSHLVTRVSAEDPSNPDHNLHAEMDVTGKGGVQKTVTLSEGELERVADMAPEIEAGIKLKEKTPEQIADEQWLEKHRDEIIQRRRATYMLDGRQTPATGWKPADRVNQAKRAAWFDELTLEQKLGLEPLPDNKVMPPITILSREPDKAYYGAPVTPPVRGGVAGFVPALLADRGEAPRAMAFGVIGTAVAGPVVRGGIAALKYATGMQQRADRREAQKRVTDAEKEIRESDAIKARQKAHAEFLTKERQRAQYLDETVSEIRKRMVVRGAKRELSEQALDHIIQGRDPAREMATQLKASHLSIADLLPGFDLERRKRNKKDKTEAGR